MMHSADAVKVPASVRSASAASTSGVISMCDDSVVGSPTATSDANDPNAATYAAIESQVEELRGLTATTPVERGLFVHVHSGRAPVEMLFGFEPGLKVIWAHAGMLEPAETVEAMMATYATLYADTSFRERDILDADGAIGRSTADAPEIDGKVFLDRATDLNPGDFVEAEVTGADEYDLWAG